MPKFFVTSDIHGYFDIFIKELTSAGFDKNNENHWLIVCGDCFDRGKQPRELKDYLDSLERKVIIRGNHESLLENMIQREYCHSYDVSNGALNTIRNFSREFDFYMGLQKSKVELLDFINSTCDYFETKNYIFVHSFYPFEIKNWREKASIEDWEEARWGNPFGIAQMVNVKNDLSGKTLVFGHWHTSWAREVFEGQVGSEDFSPYYGDGYIGIDACVAYSKKLNVIVIEDDFLEDEC